MCDHNTDSINKTVGRRRKRVLETQREALSDGRPTKRSRSNLSSCFEHDAGSSTEVIGEVNSVFDVNTNIRDRAGDSVDCAAPRYANSQSVQRVIENDEMQIGFSEKQCSQCKMQSEIPVNVRNAAKLLQNYFGGTDFISIKFKL